MVSHNPIIALETLFDHRTNKLATTEILVALWFGEGCLHHHLASPRCGSVPGPHVSTQKPLLPPSIIRLPILFHVPIVLRPALCCLLKSSCLSPPTHTVYAAQWLQSGQGKVPRLITIIYSSLCHKLSLHGRSVSQLHRCGAVS